MEEIKKILDALNSALSELKVKIVKAEEAEKSYTTQKMKLDEKDTELIKKAEDLNEREAKVKHIESIVEFTENAKKLMKEANALMENANDRQAKLEAGLKDLAKKKDQNEKELAEGQNANKKQADALKQERNDFEDKVKTYKAVAAVIK